MAARKPPEREGAGMSIAQFCARNNMSRAKYYRMRRLGRGPSEVRPFGKGSWPVITPEAEAAWRKRWAREYEAPKRSEPRRECTSEGL